MRPLYITSAADYVECVADDAPPADLKPLVAAATGENVRRIGRFIQLALIGAGRCANTSQLPNDTAVFVGSSHGDLETITEVMRASLRDGRAPKPLSFVNTVSNATCYYVAQTLKLLGRSTFVCNRYFAFESVLQLAALDLEADEVQSALLGTVDVVVQPLSEHRLRLSLAPTDAVADAAHWIVLSRDSSAPRLCRLVTLRSFVDRAALESWIDAQLEGDEWIVATGQFVDDDEAHAWVRRCAGDRFDYRSQCPHYGSQSGALINRYAHSTEHRALLHINCDPSHRYSVVLLDKN